MAFYTDDVIHHADSVTVTVPRKMLSTIQHLSEGLVERMHHLLERHTEGALSSAEKAELETLVQMAEFGQIVSMAMNAPSVP